MSEAENSSGEPPKKKNKSKSDTESKQVDDQEHRTRKISQATRTLKACDLCRRQKTRCIRSDDNRTSCIRCIFLNKPCSLDVDLEVKKSLNESLGVSISNHPMDVGIPNFTSANNSNTTTNNNNNKDKIDAIYRMVRELLAVTKNPSTAAIDSKLLIYDPLDSGPLQPLGSTVDNSNRITQSPAKLGGHHHHHQRGRQMLTTTDTVYDLDINFRPMEAIPFTVVNNMRDEINDMPKLITSIFPQWYPFMQFERKPSRKDIITLNILSLNEAIALMNDFRRNYGRWVSFPQNLPTDHLVERIREKSSFLLTTCCVISYRYSPLRMTHKKNYKILMKHLITDFKAALLKNAAMQPHRDGDIEFLQAIVILSIYLHSLSSSITNKYKPFILEDSGDDEDDNLDDEELQEFTLDPWNLSSMGLTTFISRGTLGDSLFGNMKSTTSKSSSYNPGTANDGDDINTNNTNPEDRIFTFLFDPLESSNEYQKLTVIRLYNHLTLVHLVNCVISGRMCILDDTRLDYCKNTLGLPSSTNFDGRMISEIQILVICYKFIQALLLSTSSEEVEDHYKYTQGEMLAWKGQWEYLFEQPALQFVDFCSNFVQLLVIFNYIYYKLKLEGKFKKNPTNYIPQLGNLDSVLELANMADLAIMYQYALNVVSTIRNIENDAYFAYLSDQIHFFFYFAGIVLVKMIECFKLKKVAIDYRPSRSCLKLLTKKFDAVGLNNDLISTYKNGLIQVAKKCNLDLT
ncbi:uncharacterized protein KQ657_001498 [Scheffersomyces spartinae]|uniref:Zn(2)-C6 fungal-type domain-containing protein n=1 Tax=Scheffersomyces spartinae TaxID=45513 RepID=A0A9P8AGV3_9ASCO|nr:uncharacterized protein KQ657_001498 [Scheffersomyces spartinae]KAG7192715.1 hypothetical protein KQ657_001498 [Scheffersomyces spartinae]